MKDTYTYTNAALCVSPTPEQLVLCRIAVGMHYATTAVIVTIDKVRGSVIELSYMGIIWGLTTRLRNLDFADDIAVLEHSMENIPSKSKQYKQLGRNSRSKINANKKKY